MLILLIQLVPVVSWHYSADGTGRPITTVELLASSFAMNDPVGTTDVDVGSADESTGTAVALMIGTASDEAWKLLSTACSALVVRRPHRPSIGPGFACWSMIHICIAFTVRVLHHPSMGPIAYPLRCRNVCSAATDRRPKKPSIGPTGMPILLRNSWSAMVESLPKRPSAISSFVWCSAAARVSV